MNLFDLHSNPETLKSYKHRFEVPEIAFREAEKRGIGTPHHDLERAIAKDPKWAYWYAIGFVKGRWPEGEPAIAKSPEWAAKYAHIVLKKKRFPLGEPAIATVSVLAYEYARDVIKGPFPEGEAAIAEDPRYACWYATDIIRGRFPLGEPAIAKDLMRKLNYEQMLRDIERRIIPQRFIS